ncbi:MAG: hypothetical protein H6707_19710 [Deltaproteobacteria bacterium]|nr:hypothetical protein [Deltaproteobacteria bacterium]
MHRWPSNLVALLLALLWIGVFGGCASDDAAQTPDAALVDAGPNLPDEPFGRACTNIGQICKDVDPAGYPLTCIALQGGSSGKGFCTRQCQPNGPECTGVPNGMWATCAIQDPGNDAGPGPMYCGFACVGGGGRTWYCPPSMACGAKSDAGTASCLP